MFNSVIVNSKLTSSLRRAKYIIVGLSLLATMALPVVPKAKAASSSAGARVTFTFDDGMASAYTQAAPTLAKYGFAGVNYIISGCVGMATAPNDCPAESDVPYMTWEQIADLQNSYGWEIGGHTVNHPLLASTDPENQPNLLTGTEIDQELMGNRDDLAARGFDAANFATPYGDWLPSTIPHIAKTFGSHRGFADVGFNSFPYNDYLLYDQQVQAGVSVDAVKGYIDTARATNQWLILTFHNIQPNPSTDPDDYEYATADLDAIAAYVKSLNIPVVTIAGGIAGGTNLLADGSFDAGISTDLAEIDKWTTDGPGFITVDSDTNGAYPSPTNSAKLTSTDKNIELFSPRLAIDPAKKYFVKNYLSVREISGGEIAFYIDEYDADGVYLRTQYKRSEPSVWSAQLNFEYIPTGADVRAARLQVVVTGNSGALAYLDNVQWFVQGATSGGQGGSGSGKAGDVNGDNSVGLADATIVSLNWGKSGMSRAQGDLNGDGTVGLADATLISLNWGK